MDPREIITPDAFTVAPELLGTPLARPRRRAAAMLLDLIIVAIFIRFIGSLLLPLLAGILFLRAARPASTGGIMRRGGIQLMRAAAVVLLVASLLRGYGALSDFLAPDAADELDLPPPVAVEGEPEFEWGDIAAAPIAARFAEAADEAAARRAAAELAAWVNTRSADAAERKKTADFLLASLDDAPYLPVLQESLAPYTGSAVVDTTEVARLNRAMAAYQNQNTELRNRLAAARERRGVRRIVAGLADDLGVGFGWFALYFTTFLVLLQGQTPGKRFLRVRVIRLDGKPMTWWLSFERFGGYAASFSTGLLGFAQILWDRNRQGLHDKAAGTVVIQLPHTPATPQ